MLDNNHYIAIIQKMNKLRDSKKLKKTDFVVMSYLFARLNTNSAVEIKQKTISDFTLLSKPDVCKSIKRLINNEILINVKDDIMPGFKLNVEFINE